MKAPDKGSGAFIEGYGLVTVKSGPSPDYPYVGFSYGGPHNRQYDSLHIEDWKELRVR